MASIISILNSFDSVIDKVINLEITICILIIVGVGCWADVISLLIVLFFDRVISVGLLVCQSFKCVSFRNVSFKSVTFRLCVFVSFKCVIGDRGGE